MMLRREAEQATAASSSMMRLSTGDNVLGQSVSSSNSQLSTSTSGNIGSSIEIHFTNIH
jgi:hypothetical protein